MNIFGNLMARIFGHGEAAAGPVPATPIVGVVAAAPAVSTVVVDVEAVLEAMAAKNPEKLNWRNSIVDLMKLVGMDSSLAQRKELATELGYTGNLQDSVTMNIWLHKQVLQKLADNGGKIPASLLN